MHSHITLAGWAAGALLSIMALGGCASGHHAPFVTPPEQHRDIRALESYLQSAADASDNLTLATIGQVSYGDFDAPLWHLAWRSASPARRKVLINAGIHGNEPAGVACVLELAEAWRTLPHLFESIDVDIIPIVNPWGWVHDVRFNRDGVDINRDFASLKSQEARILKEFLSGRTYDLMIDLHEDPGATGFYLYQYGAADSSLSEQIISAVRLLGYPIEENVSMIIVKTKNGIIDAPMWGLAYMRLTGQLSIANYYRLQHSRRVFTVETPTGLAMADRQKIQLMAVRMMISRSGTE